LTVRAAHDSLPNGRDRVMCSFMAASIANATPILDAVTARSFLCISQIIV
jgi:hypothetical protein